LAEHSRNARDSRDSFTDRLRVAVISPITVITRNIMTKVTLRAAIAAAIASTISLAATIAHAADGPISLAGRIVSPLTLAEADQGANAPALSADGSTIVFISPSTNFAQSPAGSLGVFTFNRISREVTMASRTTGGVIANGNSFAPTISGDGRYVAFETGATNLAPGADSTQFDVLRVDLLTGAILRANQGLGGAASDLGAGSAAISGDGRLVAFNSPATNLVANDTNGDVDIFARDMDTLVVERISVDSNEAQMIGDSAPLTPASVSHDARFVVFTSGGVTDGAEPGNNTDVYVRDRTLGTTRLVSRSTSGQAANSTSDRAALSPSGRFVVFRSAATNLVPGAASGFFVRDLQASTTIAVPRPDGATLCGNARIDDLGEVIYACAMLPVQAQQIADQVYFWKPGRTPQRLTMSLAGGNANARSGIFLGLNAEGTIMSFDSAATDLVPADTNNALDVFFAYDGASVDVLFRNGYEN
jgi:hypothetical protein